MFIPDGIQETFTSLLDDTATNQIYEAWEEFLQYLRLENGDLYTFWMSYVDLVQDLLLGLLRAAREGNWSLHLHAIRSLIPWCLAYDKLNYGRYLPAYHGEMTNLPKHHPEIYQEFTEGKFAVQLSEGNPFGKLLVDQTTEVTVNKDTQTVKGTTRFSLRSNAVSRYYLTAEYRSAFLARLRDMINSNRRGFSHPDLQQSRIKVDEEDVVSVEEILSSWVNPFENSSDLISVSTGATAPEDVATQTKEVLERGEKACLQKRQTGK